MKAFPRIVPHLTEDTKVYKNLEKIAVDYKGKFPVKSVHGNDGFYLIVDQASKLVHAHVCSSKDETVLRSALDEFKSLYETPYGHTIIRLQSDFDSVLLSESVGEWLKDYGIKLQTSAPYAHAHNGLIERAVQNVLDKARTLMSTYNVPTKYWEYAVKIACYLINRSPTSKSDLTPFETVTGSKPDIGLLVPFYAIGMYHVTKDERKGKSLAYKAQKCRMLGYDDQCKNTLVVVCIPGGKIISRKDCIFDERLRDMYTFDDMCEEMDDFDYTRINFDDPIDPHNDGSM